MQKPKIPLRFNSPIQLIDYVKIRANIYYRPISFPLYLFDSLSLSLWLPAQLLKSAFNCKKSGLKTFFVTCFFGILHFPHISMPYFVKNK